MFDLKCEDDGKVLQFPAPPQLDDGDDDIDATELYLQEKELELLSKLQRLHRQMKTEKIQFNPKKQEYYIAFRYRVKSIDPLENGVYVQQVYVEQKPKNVNRFCKQYLKKHRGKVHPTCQKVKLIQVISKFYTD